jgi:hypothetical protein
MGEPKRPVSTPISEPKIIILSLAAYRFCSNWKYGKFLTFGVVIYSMKK